MPSFDIVSEIDMVEVKNAVQNTSRELETRFDFRGVEASYEMTKDAVKMNAEHEFQLQQLLDLLRKNLVKRGVDTGSMKSENCAHSGKTVSQLVTFQEGVDQPTAKKLVKLIKDNKLKVQVAIQGEQLRVTGKKRDDLQAAMQMVKSADLGLPFQFNNFRD